MTAAVSDRTLIGAEHLPLLRGKRTIAFDTETTGLTPEVGGLRLVQFAAEGCPAIVVDYWQLDEADKAQLQEVFAQPDVEWFAHNAVFDLGWLQEHDIHPAGTVYCTMLASRLLENGIPNVRHGLAAAAKRYLDVDVSKEEQRSDWSAPVLSESQIVYAANDVRILLRMVQVIKERMKVARLEAAWALECRCLAPISHMQRMGLPFNRQKLEELRDGYERTISELGEKFLVGLDAALPEKQKLPRDEDGSFNLRAKPEGSVRLGTKRMQGFNINSPKQLVEKFSLVLGQVPVDEKTGKPSSSKDAMRNYAADHEIVQIYLAWKKAEKRRQMVVALLEHQSADGAVRANYMQLGADTGRMSCVSGNTILITSRGDFTFAEYIPQAGDLVLTHMGRWMPVVRKLYKGVEQVTEVVTAEGGMLCCTGDHRLWTGQAWVRVCDLSIGDSLGLFKEMGSSARKRGGCVGRVSQRKETDGVRSSGHYRYDVPQRNSCIERELVAREAESRKSSTSFQGENRIFEPYEGQVWFPTPQLHRGSGGSQRLPNGTEWEWRSGFPAQTCDGQGFGNGSLTFAHASTPYKWRHTGQQTGQLGAGYVQGSHRFTPSTTVVESLKPLGPMGVWDIEVEGDHSYALYGFLSHNCNSPNLQQVPRDKGFRAAAEAPDGWIFVCADFSQMELRLAAAISGDVRMTKAFQDGEDLHTITAQAIYAEETVDQAELKARRQVSKSANFGLLYGSGAKGLRNYAGSMGITMSLEEADRIRDTFHKTYSGIAMWQRTNASTADKTKGNKWAEVRIPRSELRRYLPGELNRLTTRCNTPVQGAGAAILKLSLGKLWPHLKNAGEEAVRLAAVVHDEVLLLVREGTEEHWAKLLSRVMEEAEALWLGEIPPMAEAAWGKTWADAK